MTDLREGKQAVPRMSPAVLRMFRWYSRRYLARNFHAVRLSRAGPVPAPHAGPMIIYLNHPSWWDPLVCFLLAERFFPDRLHYAPIDAAVVGKYRLFERLGMFGIELGSRRGAAKFLRVSRAILEQPNSVLWIAAAGRFVDPRERPVRLQPGISHLTGASFVPLALEYPFWEERFPEVLARFGEATTSPETLAARLEQTQDALAAEARARDRAAFDVLLKGRAGIGGVYDRWRALRARLRGETFHAEHGAVDP